MKKYKQEKANLVLDFFVEEICEYLNVQKKDVMSLKKDRMLTDIRGMAVYLTKKILPEATFMNFANYFGFKTHAAMMHAVKTIEDLQSVDFKIKQTLNHFSEMDFATAILKRYGFASVSENVFTKQTNAMNLTLKLKVSEMDFATAILKRYGFDSVSENVFTKQTNAMYLTLKLKDVEKFKCVLKFGDFAVKEIDIFDALIISKNFEDNPIGKIINLLKK